ncbi:MAG: aminotransferase class V-fold PLP-dependent enzyme [Firmicutes bacterium]|nr:aminotransferase class V-fold PLP-dependent enzyme [Bacillota bacterium]
MTKFHEIRELFPGAEKNIYLDTATSGLLPKNTYQIMEEHLRLRMEDGLIIEKYWDKWSKVDELRSKVAKLINCIPEEVYFGISSSDMINAFSANIEIPEGKEILVPDISFPSTRNTWLAREKDGAKVRYIKAVNSVVTTESIIESIDDNTFAVSICSVEPSSGYFYDLKKIGEACRDKGVYFVVDSTQGLGAMKHDVKEMKIDVLIDSTYKWMSNIFGIGLGYIRKDILKDLTPSHIGWVGTNDRMKDFSNPLLNMSEEAKKFETGGLNWLGILGLDSSLDIVENLGKENIESYILELTDYLYEKVEKTEGISFYPEINKENRSCISYLKIDNPLTKEEFLERGVVLNVSGDKIRVGLHYYNNKKDVDALISVLETV